MVSGAAKLQERTEDPGLRNYLGFIARQRSLTTAEEFALARRVREGDREAVDNLVNANLHFVILVVRKFRNRGLDDLDLIAEGTVGLIMAVRHSGWRGECRLVTVAVWWILNAVREAIDEQVGTGTVLLLPGKPQVHASLSGR